MTRSLTRGLLVAASIGVLAGSISHATAAPPVGRLPDGTFLDDEGLRPFRTTYLSAHRLGRSQPHYLRATLEITAVLALGTAYYWTQRDRNQHDWDYPDAATRFSNLAIAFDANRRPTNHLRHPISGSLYYGFSRLNGMSVPTAIGFAVASAATYELLEWREKVSINDLIFTPVGGIAIGEFFVHLGDYLHSAPRGGHWYHRAVGATLGWAHELHPRARAIDTLPADALGLSSYFAHRFDLRFGATTARNDQGAFTSLFEATATAEIVAVPGFLRPGRFALKFSDGNFTEARIHVAATASSQRIYDVSFDASLFGRYAQDIALNDAGRLGRASLMAIGTSLRYVDRNVLGRSDGFGIAHILGPVVRLWALRGDFLARLDGTAHLDFAGSQSLAYPLWVERYGAEGTRTSLRRAGYDHAIGWSARVRGLLSYRGLEIATGAFVGVYGSLDRWDRFQSTVTQNVHTTERIVELEASLAWRLPSLPLQIRVHADHLGRASDMEPVAVRRWDRRIGIEVGLRL